MVPENQRFIELVLSLCNRAVLYDNTEEFNRFAIFENGSLSKLSSDTPDWYDKLNLF